MCTFLLNHFCFVLFSCQIVYVTVVFQAVTLNAVFRYQREDDNANGSYQYFSFQNVLMVLRQTEFKVLGCEGPCFPPSPHGVSDSSTAPELILLESMEER